MLERQKILEIAKTLFNENGYFNVTMRQISNHLGISVGNLTYYYPKKRIFCAALWRNHYMMF